MTGGRVTVRNDADRSRLMRFQRIDVGIAMGIAGLVNLSMLAAAAGLFFNSGLTGVDTIEALTQASANCSDPAPRWPSRSPCSPRALPARASGLTPGRSSCRGSSRARSRCWCAGW